MDTIELKSQIFEPSPSTTDAGTRATQVMEKSIPNEWLVDPPSTLVAGDGPYTTALALILKGACVSMDRLSTGPCAESHEGFPQVFRDLVRILLVLSDRMAPHEALRAHEAAWNWVAKLAPEGDQHELVFVFILQQEPSGPFESALAAGLGVEDLRGGNLGHVAWRRSGRLEELLRVLTEVKPADLLPLRLRRAADAKHVTISSLRQALGTGDALTIAKAAELVMNVFRDQEYQLDVFCAPPSHQHGNMLRTWLRKVVSESVTPDDWPQQIAEVQRWMRKSELLAT